MFEPRFNSRPINAVRKNKRRKGALGHLGHAEVAGSRPAYDFDSLDAGFDDLAAGPNDVMIAPGLVAHFGQFPGGNANRHYYYVPQLERIVD